MSEYVDADKAEDKIDAQYPEYLGLLSAMSRPCTIHFDNIFLVLCLTCGQTIGMQMTRIKSHIPPVNSPELCL